MEQKFNTDLITNFGPDKMLPDLKFAEMEPGWDCGGGTYKITREEVEKFAKLMLTDSGCVQEEAYIFGVPCVTIRNNTERHVTVNLGANVVCGFDPQQICEAAEKQLSKSRIFNPPIYGLAGVGSRIIDHILANFKSYKEY